MPDTTTTDTAAAASHGAHGHPGYVSAEDKAKVLARLRRVEGQVRGLQRMVEQDTYCTDVLTQIAAVSGALQGVALTLVRDHVRHCVAHDLEGGDEASLESMMSAIGRLLR